VLLERTGVNSVASCQVPCVFLASFSQAGSIRCFTSLECYTCLRIDISAWKCHTSIIAESGIHIQELKRNK
jgi:hypothetical protein